MLEAYGKDDVSLLEFGSHSCGRVFDMNIRSQKISSRNTETQRNCAAAHELEIMDFSKEEHLQTSGDRGP